MERETITLRGAQETMLATLYGRALDSRATPSVLHDRTADEVVSRIDYNFRKTGINPMNAASVAIRGKQLDLWTREFLDQHPEATVLHLACGLDTRVQRLSPPASVRWIDVDYPGVIELRERLLPEPGGDYRMVPSSVTADAWLDDVPADRPTVAVFEGLSMYLSRRDGQRLIRRITERFPSGQLLFDCFNAWGIRSQKLVTAVRRSGATLQWAIDDPRELESLHDGLRCVDVIDMLRMPDLDKLPTAGRITMAIVSRIPMFRDMGRLLRYEF